MRAELLESILPSEASVFESLGQSMASELRALGSSIAWDQPLEEAARRIPVRAYAEVIQGPNSTGTEWPVLRVPASSPTSVQLFGGGFVSHTIERAGGCSAVNSSSTYEIAPDRWVGVYVGGDLPLMEYIDVDKCIKHGSVTFEESLQAVANGRTPILQAGGASESSDACTTSEMQYARCTYGMRPWACSARKTQLGTRTQRIQPTPRKFQQQTHTLRRRPCVLLASHIAILHYSRPLACPSRCLLSLIRPSIETCAVRR